MGMDQEPSIYTTTNTPNPNYPVSQEAAESHNETITQIAIKIKYQPRKI